MRTSVLTLALCFGVSHEASAELIARLNFGGLNDIKALVLCSQHPDFNADRLRKFLREAIGITQDFVIVDGPVQFEPPDEGRAPVSKAIVVFAKGEPDDGLKRCVDETVPFGDAVFDNIDKAQAALGKPLNLPVSTQDIQYGPVRYSASGEKVPNTEWTIHAAASDLPNPSAVNDAMLFLFQLAPEACSGNRFCLPLEK